MDIGRSLCKLTVGSTFLLGGLAFPPILAGEGIVWGALLATALASAAAGNTANAIDALVDRKKGDRVSLENEDLTKAVGKAIAAVITLAAKNKKYPKKTREHLEKIAAKAKDNWVELARFELSEAPYIKALSKHNYRGLMEEQLPKALTPTETGLTAETILTAGEWRNIFLKLDLMADADGGFELSSEVKQEVADLLYTTFPKALRETLKEDFASDGKAFAGLTIQLLAGMRKELVIIQRKTRKHRKTTLVVLKRLRQLKTYLEGTEAQIQAIFSEISQEINSGFAEVCQRLGIFETNITQLLKSLEESVKNIEEKVTEIHAGLNPNPLTIENWREICRQNLALQKQLTTNPFDGVTRQRDEIYIPLPILASKLLSMGRLQEKEEKKLIPIAEESFFEEVLRQGKSEESQGRKIAITGEPGSGKTTRLQKIADWILEQDLGLPIWIDLAELGEQDICEYLQKKWLPRCKGEPTRRDLERQISRIWLLLDGVDEMTHTKRIEQLAKDLLRSWVQGARVIVTCRVNVWEADKKHFSGFDVFRNLEFNSEQVTEYIRRWFAEIGDTATQTKKKSLEVALAQSKNYHVKELIKNPLRLWMLCQIWQTKRGYLPQTQAELYKEFVKWVYSWKTDTNIGDEIDRALRRLALAAIEHQDEDSRFQLRESWVLEILGSRSIFEAVMKLPWLNRVERFPEAVCVFYHATFQEYFAALAVDDWDYFLPRNHVNFPVPGKEYRIFASQWKQVILLWLGRGDVTDEKKNGFIEKLIKFDDGCGEWNFEKADRGFYEYRAYFLAAVGLAEFPQCRHISQMAPESLIKTSRLFNISALVKILENNNFYNYSRILAQLILEIINWGNKQDINLLIQLVLYPHTRDFGREQAAEIIGKTGADSEQVIKDLSQTLTDLYTDKDTRWQLAVRLGKIGAGSEQAINALSKTLIAFDTDKDTRWQVAVSLGKIGAGNERAINALSKTLIAPDIDKDTRWQAAVSLGKIGVGSEQAVNALCQTLVAPYIDKDTRCQTAVSLGKIGTGNEQAINQLLQLLSDSRIDLDFKIIVIENLGKIGNLNRQVISYLVKLMRNFNVSWEIRRKSADTLGKMSSKNESVVKLLLKLLKQQSSDWDVHWLVVKSLANAESIDVQTYILDFLENQNLDKHTYVLALWSLGNLEKKDKRITTFLRKKAEDVTLDIDIRKQALKSLKKIIQKPKAQTSNENVLKNQPDIEKKKSSSIKTMTYKEIKDIVVTSKERLSSETYKHDFNQFEEYYKLIWNCAQELSYPDFYQAWHDITGSINLSQLPQLLETQLTETSLHHTLQVFYIDGSKFSDRDNPATKIYRQMTQQGCPKSADGKPKTMAELQDYWEDLIEASDKTLALIFYEDPKPPTPQGFSETFLNALTRFDGPICTIGDSSPLTLQSFSPQAPQLIQSIIAWLQRVVLET